MNPNPEELISVDTLIAAIETEDELGMVLRLHLVIEHLLNVYLKYMRKGEIAEYVKQPREFGGKLSLAAAFGLPLHLVRVMHPLGFHLEPPCATTNNHVCWGTLYYWSW